MDIRTYFKMLASGLRIAIAIFASLASAATVPAGKRSDGGLCYAGVHEIANNDQYGAQVLANACFNALGNDRSGIWSNRLCVAAAVAAIPVILIDYANCGDLNTTIVPAEANFASLDYNVYASIVGDCAWAESGCPITEQNFIDLVYSELTAIGSTVWPTSAQQLINDRILPIFTWTKFSVSQGVPYLNFNDYLHYS